MAALNFAGYSIASTIMTSSVIYNAYTQKHQFYVTVIYLIKSKFSLLVLFNFAFVLFFLIAKLTRRIFLGTLRRSEVELLWENTGYAVTETCLALTIFRNELNLTTYLLFSFLLFFKAFHWLCKARVEHIEQDEDRYRSKFSHIRIFGFILLLASVDFIFTSFAVMNVLENGVSVQLLFGFEFLLLTLSSISIFFKYTLIFINMFFITGRWYNKSLYEMYLRLLLAIVHFIVYAVFFSIVFTFYGVPIHLMRSLYLSFHTVTQRLKHFIQFKRVTKRLNTNFANATQEELDQTDKICVICREEMTVDETDNSPEKRIKKLTCGHIFHFYCLRNWFERQLKCPTCRADISSLASPRPSPVVQRRRNVNVNAQNNNVVRQAVNRANNIADVNVDPAGLNFNQVIEEMDEIERNENEEDDDDDDDETQTNITDDDELFERDMRYAFGDGERNFETLRQRRDQIRDQRAAAAVLLRLENMRGLGNTPRNTEQAPSPPPPMPGVENMNTAETQSRYRGMPVDLDENNFLSVNDYLRNQVDHLSLQLQLYSAQISAANAAHEAALELIKAQEEAEENDDNSD